jgi:hypothetical protein
VQVALYPRVSTSQQEQTETIARQQKALHAYMAAYDRTVFPAHSFLENGVGDSR